MKGFVIDNEGFRCPRYVNTDDSGIYSHGNIYGFYLYNAHLDAQLRVEFVTDSSYKYCNKFVSSATYIINISFKGWTSWDELLNFKDAEINFWNR